MDPAGPTGLSYLLDTMIEYNKITKTRLNYTINSHQA